MNLALLAPPARPAPRGPRSRYRSLVLLVALLGSIPALAQGPAPLTVRDALARADALAYTNRVARGAAEEATAQTLAPLPGVLPSVRLETGLVRTSDPIGAFGIAMRQERLTASDFDPSRLNDPAVAQNVGTGLVIEQPLFNADAWLGRRAATLGARSARRSVAWSEAGTRVDVISAYYGAVLATVSARTLRAAQAAALEHARVATALVENGMATRSDALLASVRAGEIEVQRLAADANVATARLALANAMGTPGDTGFVLPEGLPEAPRLRALAERALHAAPVPRADVEAAQLASQSARADHARARSLYLPRLNTVARYDLNAPSRAFGSASNWTVMIMASWPLFSGGHEEAERRTARAREDVAATRHEAAVATAELEIARTTSELQNALARLRIADEAVAQSGEAQRIVERKYAGGLASVVELLTAAAVETRSRLSAAEARHALLVAIASRLRAVGADPLAITELDQASGEARDASPGR